MTSVTGGVWKAVETKTRKARVTEVEKGRKQKKKEQKKKLKKNNESKKDSRGIEDLG